MLMLLGDLVVHTYWRYQALVRAAKQMQQAIDNLAHWD